MRTKKFLLAAAAYLSVFTTLAQTPCNLGTVTPATSSICAGSSVTLQANVNNFNRCFTDTVKSVGNQNYQFSSVAVDQQNNVILSGAYTGDINIGIQNLAGFGARDLFIVKYDSCGKLAWTIRGGSVLNDQVGSDAGKGIAVDASGNIYIVGRYNQTCHILGTNGTSFTSPYTINPLFPSEQDGFLIKVSPNGQIVWGVTLTGGSNDGFNGVTVDGEGNPIVTGVFNGSPFTGNATIIDASNSLYSLTAGASNASTAVVIKFNATGSFQWMTRVFNKESVTSGITTDGSNIYVTGWFSSASDGASAQVTDAFGAVNSIQNAGTGNAYLLKLNNTGNFIWAKSVGNSGASGSTLTYGNDLAIDDNGDIWIAGFFSGDSFSGLTASSGNSGFVSKYDASGNLIFSKSLQISQGNDTKFNGIAVNGNTIAVVGAFKGGNVGGNDILLTSYDVNGNQLNLQTYGGSGDDIAYAVKGFEEGFMVSGTNGIGSTITGVNLPAAGNFLWNTTASGAMAGSLIWSTGSTTPTITVSPDITTTYTCTFNNGVSTCTVSATVTVNPVQTPVFSAIQDTICASQTPFVLSSTSDNGINGSWSVDAITATGSYTFTPDSGQCAVPVIYNVTVQNSRRPVFGPIGPFCYGSLNANLPSTSLNGVAGTWNPATIDIRRTRTYTFTPNPGVCAYDTTITITIIDTFAVFNTVPRNISFCAGATAPVLPTTSSNNVTGTWSPAQINNQQSGSYVFTPNAGQCAYGHPYRVYVTVTPRPTQPTVECYQTATFNTNTCSWDVTGTQPTQPTVACYQTATFNTNTCSWDVTGTQPTQPTVECYQTATFNTNTCSWDVTGTQPTQPTVACYQTATFNTSTCSWDVTGTQTTQPTVECYQTATFNTNTCSWDVTGTQPAQPTVACYQTATWNANTCSWDVTGTQPTQPTVACYQTATFNTNTCSWDVTGTQPTQPTVACYQTATFNTTTCTWDVTGTQPTQPTVACYQTATFNTNTCSWDVTGTQPTQPTVACYQTTTWNATTCSWDVTGTQPTQPNVECYQTATFITTTCSWDVTGTQPTQPNVECYQTATWNPTTCSWDVTGTQPTQPTVECYQTATWNATTCSWDVTGVAPTPIVNNVTSCGSYHWASNDSTINETGTYTHTYINNTGCEVTDTLHLTIAPIIHPTFIPILPICQGSVNNISLPTTSLENIPGIWSPQPISNTTSGCYTFTPEAGYCADTAVVCIEIRPRIIPVFQQISSTICISALPVALPSTSDNNVGGIWTDEFGNIVTEINGAGVYNFYPNADECADAYTITVTVLPSIATPVFAQSSITVSGSSYDLDAGANYASYLWNTHETTQTIHVTNSGTYSVTVSNGACTSTGTIEVILQAAQLTQGDTTICAGSSVNLGIIGTQLGDVILWNPTADNTSSVTVTPNQTTIYTAQVNGTTIGSVTITVIAEPEAPTANLTQPTCNVATGCITITGPANGNFTLDNNSATFGVNNCGLISGDHIVVVTGEGGCTNSTMFTINPQPHIPAAPTSITGQQNVCNEQGSGTALTYTVNAVPGATSYIWTLPSGVTTDLGQSGTFSGSASINIYIPANFSTLANKQIKVRAVNDCGRSAQYIYYLRTDRPNFPVGVSLTASSTEICSSIISHTPITYCVTPAAYATSYLWAWPGHTQTTTTPCIDIQYDNSYLGGYVSVKPLNPCGVGNSEVIAIPDVFIAPELTADAVQPTCAVSTGTITVTSPLGAQYTYSIDGGSYQSSPVFADVPSGTHSITVAHPTLCVVNGTISVVINDQPTIPATPSVTGPINICDYICTGNAVPYTAVATGASMFHWYAPSHGLIVIDSSVTADNSTVNISFACGLENQPNKQIRVVAVNDCGATETIIYYTAAQAPTLPPASSIVPSSTDVCAGTVITYTLVPGGSGSSWQWTLPDGSVEITSTPSITLPTQPSGGQLCVRVRNSCGESEPRCTNIPSISSSVPSTPGIITGTNAVCNYIAPNGACANYSVNPVNNATSYNWSLVVNGTTTAIPGNGNSICYQFPAGFNGGVLQVTATNDCGVSGVRSFNIPVRTSAAAPVFTISQPNCNSTTGTINIISPVGAGYQYILSDGTVTDYPSTAISGVNPGNYTLSVQNTSLCLLATSVNLTINPQPVYSSSTTAAICDGASYDFPWGGSTQSADTYTHSYAATDGCDSVVTIVLSVNPVYHTTEEVAICDNQTYALPWDPTPVSQAGSYSHTYSTVNGCDSIRTINLTVNPTYHHSFEVAACDNVGYILPWDGSTVYQTGAYTYVYKSVSGCDSIVTYNVTIHPTYIVNQDASICDNQTFPLPWGGNVSDETTYTHTYTTVYGCDSVVNIHLHVNPTFDTTIAVSICDGQQYQLPWGQFATNAGTYTHLYTTSNGCDSTVHYELTVNPLPSIPVADIVQPTCTSATGCINVTSPVGAVYTYSINGGSPQTGTDFCNLLSGSYTVTVTNENGCSSSAVFVINEQPTVPPVPSGMSTATENVCPFMGTGTELQYCITPVPTATSYQWTLPPNVTTTGGLSGTFIAGECISITIPAGFNQQPNKQIRVDAINECGHSSTYIYYLRTDRPTFPVGAFVTASGTAICESINNQTPIQYCVTPASSAVAYAWSWNGHTDTTSSPCIDIQFDIHYNGGLLAVTALNDCGISSTETLSLPNVSIAPALTAQVNQPTCTAATGTVTILTPVGTGYAYAIDGGAYQSSPVFEGVATGSHTVTVTHPTICVVDHSIDVVVDEQPRIPSAPVVGSVVNVCQFICTDTLIRYTANAYGATLYHWSTPNHGLIQIVSANSDSSEVYVKFLCGLELQPNKQIKASAENQCGISPITIFYVQAQAPTLPAGSGITASGSNSCLGGDVTYTLTPSGVGPQWQWTLPDGSETITNSPSIVLPSYPTGGQLCVKVKNNCGLSNARCVNIPSYQSQLPSTPGIISGPNQVCGHIAPGGTCATYSVDPVADVTYSWSLTTPSGTEAIASNGNSICYLFPAGFNGGVMQVTATNACGTSDVRTFNIPVRPAAAAATLAVTQPNCGSETGSITINSPVGNGYEYVLNGNVITYPDNTFNNLLPGTYTVYVQNLSACLFASATAATIHPRPVYTSSQDTFVCNGQVISLPWGGLANEAGTYTHTYSAADGCDSTVTINVNFYPSYQVSMDTVVCDNAGYVLPWGDVPASSGSYQHSYATINGCDSVVNINVVIHPTYNITQEISACDNTPYTLNWGDIAYTTGDYTHLYTSAVGCDSTVTAHVVFYPSYQINIDTAVCENSGYVLPWGETPTLSGVYTHTYSTVNSCDSTVTIHLTLHSVDHTLIDTTVCDNAGYVLPWGETPAASGSYNYNYSSVNGCDSLVTVNLVINPTYHTSEQVAICQNQVHVMPWGDPVSVAGSYTHTYVTVNGCDSIVTVNLSVNPTYLVTIDTAICDNATYLLPWNEPANQTGTYTHVYSTINACDSTVMVNLTVHSTYHITNELSICEGSHYELPWGDVVSTPGSYSHNEPTVFGCDSIVTVIVTVNPLPETPQYSVTQPTCTSANACLTINSPVGNGSSYTLDGGTSQPTENTTCGLTTGQHSFYVTNSYGCRTSDIGFEVLPRPTVPVIDTVTGTKNICSFVGDTLSYSVIASVAGTSYQWSLPPMGIAYSQVAADQASIQIVFNADIANAPNKQIRVTGSNACGEGNQYILYLRADLPSAPGRISASGTDICGSAANNTAITYSTTSVYAASAYCWTLPTGATSPNQVCSTQSLTIPVYYNSAFLGGDIAVHAINGCGNGPDRVFHLSNVAQAPLPQVDYVQTDCNNATVAVTVTTPVGTGYQYRLDQGAAQTDPEFVNVGAGNHTITVFNTANCLFDNQTTFVINEQPVVPAMPESPVGENSLCSHIGTNEILTYTVTPVAGAANYQWTADQGITIVDGQGTNSITVTVNTDYAGGTIAVAAQNACGSSGYASVNMIQIPPVAPAAINGPASVCENVLAGTTVNYSVSPVQGSANYHWTVTGGDILADNGDNITVSFPIEFMEGDVSVSVATVCGTSSSTLLHVVNNIDQRPFVANVISQPTCNNPYGCIQITSPLTTPDMSVGYEYSVDGINYQNSIDFCGLTSGNHLLFVRRNGYCMLNAIANVVINQVPVFPSDLSISGVVNVCEYINTGQQLSYVASSSSIDAQYVWSYPDHSVTNLGLSGIGNNTLTLQFNNGFDTVVNKQIRVLAISSCGTNENIFYLRADAPSNPGRIIGPVNVCSYLNGSGSYATYTIPLVANAINYNWILPTGSIIYSGQGTNSITVTFPVGFAGGNITVVASNNCGSVTRSIRINACTSPFAGNASTAGATGKAETVKETAELYAVVFPNPTTSAFNIKVSSTQKEQVLVNITDLHGRLIKTLRMLPSETTNFGNELRPGTYFAEVIQNGVKTTRRIIKF